VLYLFEWVLCMLQIRNFSLRFIERLRKLMELCNSFTTANFIVVCCLLNSFKVSSMFVFIWSRIKRMSSTYLKYPII
jgi:hypothetical protein